MAVEIPVVINIDAAFADAAAKVPKAVSPLRNAISELNEDLAFWREQMQNAKIDSADFRLAAKEFQNISQALEVANDRFLQFSSNEGSIKRMNIDLALLNRRWEEMGATQKFTTDGKLTDEAKQLRAEYSKVTAEIKKSGQSLSQLEAEEQRLLELKKRGQQSRNYENKILNTTVKTVRVLQEQERILSSRLQTTEIGSKKYIDLSARLKEVRKDMALAEAQIRRGGDAYRNVSASAKTAATSINATNVALSKQGGIFSRLLGYVSGYTLLFAGLRFVHNIRETTAELELQRVALGGILQDAGMANDLFRQIKAAALKSPFEIKDLVTYTKQLAAYRIENDKLFDVTMKLADVSAGLGVDMNRLILAYGQVRAASVLRGQELRQFTEAGIPLVEKLAEKFRELGRDGTTTADVFELISKRAVPFSMIESIFDDMTKAGGEFYKMQEKQSETLKGQWMKLKDSVTIMYDEIGNTATVHNAMTSFINSANNLAKSWRSVANWAKTLIGVIVAYNVVAKASVLATNSITKAEAMRLAVTKAQSIAMPKFIASIIGETAAKKASAVASRALEIAQYRLATATTLTGKAFWGLWAALIKNPYAAAAAALTALGLGIYTLIKNNKEAKISVDELEKSISKFKNSAEKAKDTERLVDAYEELTANADRTTKEQERLDRITRELSKTFPSAVDGIDKETGALKINIDKVKELTRAEQELELARLKRDEKRARSRVKELEQEQENILDAQKLGGYYGAYSSASYSSKEAGNFIPFNEDDLAKMGDRLNDIREELEPLKKDLEQIERLENNIIDGGGDASVPSFTGWKEALSKIQEEKVKAGASAIFTTDDIQNMKTMQDLWKKVKSGITETKTELTGLKTLQKSLSDDKKAQNEEDIKLTEKQLDLYEAIKAAFGFVFSSGSSGGYQQDPFINRMQERIKFMQDFKKGYDDLRKYMTDDVALDEQLRIMKNRGLSLGIDPSEQLSAAKNLSDWYTKAIDNAWESAKKHGAGGSIESFLQQEIKDTSNRGKALKDFQKLIQSLWDAKTDFDTSELKRNMEEALKRLEDDIKRSETAKNFFNDIFDLTGDTQLATNMAVSVYGNPGKEFADRIKESIDGAMDALSIDEKSGIGDSLKTAIENLDFRYLMANLDKLPEKLRKPIQDAAQATEKYNSDIVKDYAKLLNKFDEMEQQRVNIEKQADKDIETLRKGLALEIEGIMKNTEIQDKDSAKSAAEARVRAAEESIKREKDLQLSRLTRDYRLFFSSIGVISDEAARKVANNQKEMLTEQFNAGQKTLAQYKRELREIDEQLKKYSTNKGLLASYLSGGIDETVSKLGEYSDSLLAIADASFNVKDGSWLMNEDDKKYIDKLGSIFGGKIFGVSGRKDVFSKMMRTFNGDAKQMKEALEAAASAIGEMGSGMSAGIGWADLWVKNIGNLIIELDKLGNQGQETSEWWNKTANILMKIPTLGLSKSDDAGDRFAEMNEYAMEGFEKFKSGNFVGALADVIRSWSAMFGPSVKAINRDIKEQDKLLDDLEHTYSRLDVAMEKSFGAEYIYNYNKQLDILQAKVEAYQKQAELEESKGKKADQDKIDDYLKKARDAEDQIADMQAQLTEFFSGMDLTSAAEDFANAWIEAYKEFGSTTDAMSEKFNEMINNMINRSLAAKIMQEMLQPIFDQIDTMSRDGLLSTEEISSIAALAQERIPLINDAMTNLMTSLASAGLDLRTSTAGFQGISKSIAGASEESILGLAAGINTQNFYMSYVPTISENVAQILAAMTGGVSPTAPVATTETGEVMPSVQQMVYDNLPYMKNDLAEILRLFRSVITTKNSTTQTNYIAVR